MPAHSSADWVALCLEDAVPLAQKRTARNVVREALFNGVFRNRTVFVCIDAKDSVLLLEDLDAVACKALDGFVYPKACDPNDVKTFAAQLGLMETHLNHSEGHFALIVLIETPQAVSNAFDIATASPRVVALLFGCEDYERAAKDSLKRKSIAFMREKGVDAEEIARALDIEIDEVLQCG